MKRRKLTPFLAREMLYDYATGQLDPSRKQAVEDFIETDREAQMLLANIRSAIAYTKKISDVQIDPQLLNQLKEAESALSLGKKYSSWAAWPESLRWSITALGLSALVAALVSVVPWSRLTKRTEGKPGQTETIEVAQIPVGTPDLIEAQNVAVENEGSGDEPPGDAIDEGPGDEGSGDEHDDGEALASHIAVQTPVPTPTPMVIAKATAAGSPIPAPAAGRSAFAPYFLARRNPFIYFEFAFHYVPNHIVPPHKPLEATPIPIQVAKHTPAPAPSPMADSKPVEHVSVQETERNENNAGDEKPRGFVYRAFMTLPNLEELSPKIAEDLESLGAEKAGEVELGWKRGTGRYFHFVLPEENEKKALEKLQVYGPVRISKDPHPRVMPEGQVRFILWIESAN